jgi:hypothetical protein
MQDENKKLAYDYTVWVAPEMLALLKKGAIFMEKHPQLFHEGELERAKESIVEFEEVIRIANL